MTAESASTPVVFRSTGGRKTVWVILILALILAAVVSLGIGRLHISISRVVGLLASHVIPLETFWTETDARVVELIRLPRIIMAVLTGAGLAMAGAGLQGIFRNPLVGPQIVGVSSGASFGGVLAILLFESQVWTISFAFVFGLAAVFIVYFMSQVGGRSSVLTLVLAGVVTSAFFSALVSLIKYTADPYDKLPAIVFWLMGSLATVTHQKVLVACVPVLLAGTVLYLMAFRINVLSLGDEEAEALGVRVEANRWVVLICVTMITSALVAVCGVIGWVGLVVPHIGRMLVGPDHRVLVPASGLLGGLYLLIIDDLARALTPAEIPIGIITAVIGAPVFGYLLKRTQAKGWSNA
jgi:iron complex transport system permease protein